MRKSKFIALMLIVLSTNLITLPIDAKEVEINCKTQKGKNVTYLINSNQKSVKDGEDGYDYEVLLFSPTKLVFKKEVSMNLGSKYFNSEFYTDLEFTYTIDRTNLNYQVNQKNYTNADNLPKTGVGGDNYTGKCSVLPRKPVAF